jgi:hypothetical protein
MGDIAELMIMGFLCEQCGIVIDEEVTGFPRQCEDCKV